MSDLEMLFAVLAVIYFWECSCWLARGTVAFRRVVGRKWNLAYPGAVVGNQRGGFVLAFPLPPLGNIVTANQFPISLSAEAALAFVSVAVNPSAPAAQTARFLSADQIRTMGTKGRKLMINKEVFLKAASATYASYAAEQIRKWLEQPAAKRAEAGAAILRAAFDVKAAERRWQEFQKQALPLLLLTNGLFLYLFVFAPLLIWTAGFHNCWLELLIGLPLFTVSAAFYFRAGHRRFYPAAEEERFTHFLTVMLSPATTVRAQDVLTRPLLETFHPLTVAKLFCDEATFLNYARRVLIETRYPVRPLGPRKESSAQAVERDWRAMLLKETERFLKKNSVDLDRLSRPPLPADESSLSFCPRCEAQFTTREGFCADCGDLELIPFAKAPGK